MPQKRRATCADLDVAQAQNKRTRVLSCVLIPCSPHSSDATACELADHKPSLQTLRRGNNENDSGRPRRQRATAKVSYALLDFDRSDSVPADSDYEYLTQSDDAVNEVADSEHSIEDSQFDVCPEEESPPSRKRPKAQRQPAPGVQQSSRPKPAVSKIGQTQSPTRMLSLLIRGKDDAKGLDRGLPPLSRIEDIFEDMTTKAKSLGLNTALEHLASRPLRVATMCSGTESPLLALHMISDSLNHSSAQSLQIEHLFSAEIVPYKQAYIERNFKPPIIFRDITEITAAVEDEIPHATTAYGARVPIPTKVDILIAGTSCVDFSKLNAHQKGLDAENGGESSQTWYAVLAYVKAFRPAIVLLENVKNAAWESMLECYEDAGYHTCGVLVDSKDYYIPHTRQRGYMACFDKRRLPSNASDGVGERWQSLMRDFRRFASSPVPEFLLPSDVINQKRASFLDDPARDIDWSQCEIRQMDYRQSMRLGNARPFTRWQESGTISVPEDGSASWYRKQSERVKDCIDCSILRKALPEAGMYDARFKTRIWNLSQNIDRFTDTGLMGITGCITPSGIFFVSDAGRILAPEETLKLQGLPLSKVSFTTESSSELQDLAGNAMTSTVVGSAILAALICGYSAMDKASWLRTVPAQETLPDLLAALPLLAAKPTRHLQYAPDVADLAFPGLAKAANEAARRCICESARGLTDKPIQQCVDCGHTTCKLCGGNPVHNYEEVRAEDMPRAPASDFEKYLRHRLPLRLAFDDGHSPTVGELGTKGDKHGESFQAFHDVAKAALDSIFSLHRIRRTHQWTVEYTAPTARLDLILLDGRAEWRLYATPAIGLPGNSLLRAMLQQPVARIVPLSMSSSELQEWRSPDLQSAKLRIEGRGTRVASWWARNQMPDFKDHKVWDQLCISVRGDADLRVREQIEGLYQHLPNCGTANDSLYKKVDSRSGRRPVYLFRDPTRTGSPDDDCFVFAHGKERLDYGEVRPILASLESGWTPWLDESFSFSAPNLVSDRWASLERSLQEVKVEIDLRLTDKPHFDECGRAELIACSSVSVEPADQGVPHRAKKLRPEKLDLEDEVLFLRNAWLLEALRRHLPTESWVGLGLESADTSCDLCAPRKPALRWNIDSDGVSIKPYEDPADAAAYERSVKVRPDPMYFEKQVVGGRLRIAFGIDALTLAHRARARLPTEVRVADVSWRLREYGQGRSFAFKPFSLSATKHVVPWTKDLGMTCPLFPKQRLVLRWMTVQEKGRPFAIEESEEATLPKLDWSFEVRVKAYVSVRGGICADHPGFGKTITSLALIQSQLREQSSEALLCALKAHQSHDRTATGLIPVQATLIVSPGSLVKQWQAEINDKLGYGSGILVMSRVGDLDKYTIDDFKGAKIIVVNRKILADDAYAERLAAFAAVPGPSTNSGRSFAHWLEYACSQVAEHLSILQDTGLKALRAHIAAKYKARVESEAFRAVVPSRRLRGKKVGMDNGAKSKKAHLKPAASSIKTEGVDRPLFEMFYFNRLIVDEFHDLDSKGYAATVAIKANKRWGLSATPKMNDFYDISQMAGLIGVPLRVGSFSTDVMKAKNIKTLQKELSDFERFDAMRQIPSNTTHSRIHEIDQAFLDAFVRQNIMDFGELSVEDHLVPVTLDIDHRTVYSELSHHLNSQDMNMRKAKSGKKTDLEQRLLDSIADSESAEEALSRHAAYYARESGTSSKEGLADLVSIRDRQVQSTLNDLREAAAAAQRSPNPFIEKLHNSLVAERALGDDLVVSQVAKIFQETSACISQKAPKRLASTVGDREGDTKRSLTADVNKLAKRLLVATRSHRYVRNVHRVVQHRGGASGGCDMPSCHSENVLRNQVSVSALCGHLICVECHSHLQDQHDSHCPAKGCEAPLHDYHLLWKDKMGELAQTTAHGAKVDAALAILDTVKDKGEQAILFVQYETQLLQVHRALKHHGIAATVVTDASKAGEQIARFRTDSRDIVIVLNASDETAAGSNLQNANHVIFLSPLLRNTQYLYESTMAQAVGRVRRHGQVKKIHIYRIVALDTIDVDILEHRERRLDALTEQGAPAVRPPTPKKTPDQHDALQRERVQLVRENAFFSLRPRSWLVRDDGEAEQAIVSRRHAKNRAKGWEDFSALVKFSRAYTEDDD